MAVTISTDDFNEILTIVGFPIIAVTDLGLSDENIKKLLIFPAMRTYFRFFPIQVESEHEIGTTTFEIAFPDSYTFGVVDARLNTARYRGLAITGSPFLNAQNIGVAQRHRGMYGTRNNYEFTLVRSMENLERQSIIDTNKAFKIKIDEGAQTVSGFSNVTGRLSITWAKYSQDFSDVSFNKFDDVKQLAQANILEYLGMLRSQQTTDIPNILDPRVFLDKATDLRNEVMTKFREFTKVVILR
ncbi:hypothetical protein LCGC14_1732810, partial [marine sediment metagenome]